MITTVASFFINGKVQSYYLCVLFNHDSINIGGGGSMTRHIREICSQKRHFLVILFLRITYLGKIWKSLVTFEDQIGLWKLKIQLT